MKYLLSVLLLLCQLAATAQCFKAYDAPTGGKELTVFCVGQRVYFVDCAGTDADKIYYDYDNSNGLEYDTPEGRAKSFIYTQPGTYTVTQLANLSPTKQTEQVYEVKATAAPAFTAQVCSGRRVTVMVTDNSYDNYTLDLGDGRSPVTITKGQPGQFTYASDGTYTLTLTGAHAAGSCTTTPAPQTISTLPELVTPELTELMVLNKDASTGAIRFTVNQLQPSFFDYSLIELGSSGIISRETLENLPPTGPYSFTKQNLNTSRYTHYVITATDPCGHTSQSYGVYSVILSATVSADAASVSLKWEPPANVGGSNPLRFTVELLDDRHNVIESFPANGITFTHLPGAVDEPFLRYRIKAIPSVGNFISYSNIVEIPLPVRLFIPSAFSPNGDGLNDVFEVKGKFTGNFQLKIYNSLGAEVFASTDPAVSWDGTFRGQEMPQGTYAYHLTVEAADGMSRTRKGTVTLIR